jgi:polysaccharide biosynthesis PFTS motif protein
MDDEVLSPTLVNMSFDHVFTVGRHFTTMYRKHTDNVGAYHEIGLIRTARKWGPEDNRPPIWDKFSCIDNDKNMVIVIFDESPISRDVELAMPNWKEIWNYLDDIFHFMDSETNIRFIFKPKHREKGSMGAALDCEIRTGLPFHSLREKMKRMPSVQVLDYRVDSVYAIMMADLVISPCFSTTGMEALALEKKSIYYDPQSIHKEHKYSRIDNLVAHGYDELKQLVSFWVHASEKQRIDVIRCLKDEVVISNEDPIARFVNILSGRRIVRYNCIDAPII